MTKLTYRLADGTTTARYADALASGQTFTRCYEPIIENNVDPEKAKQTYEAIKKKIREQKNKVCH